jgi:hypothetical protein
VARESWSERPRDEINYGVLWAFIEAISTFLRSRKICRFIRSFEIARGSVSILYPR